VPFLCRGEFEGKSDQTMIILGLNAFHADSSAALLRDGRLIAAAEEERFRRIKHWAGFPSRATYCLREAGVRLSDVDHIALNQDSRVNLTRKIGSCTASIDRPTSPRCTPNSFLDRLAHGRTLALAWFTEALCGAPVLPTAGLERPRGGAVGPIEGEHSNVDGIVLQAVSRRGAQRDRHGSSGEGQAIADFRQDFRAYAPDQFQRSVPAQDDDEVDRLERGGHLGARVHVLYRPPHPSGA
jgi:hypothetical protein